MSRGFLRVLAPLLLAVGACDAPGEGGALPPPSGDGAGGGPDGSGAEPEPGPCDGAAGCDDGNVCNGVESCHPTLGCVAGDALVCPDDGLPCTGVETCDPGSGCVSVDPPAGCCATAADCDDGDPCNGEGLCALATGTCGFEPPPSCDDGDPCNGAETCAAGAGCVPGAEPLSCDDGDPCTADACEPGTGCAHEPMATAACSPCQPPWGFEETPTCWTLTGTFAQVSSDPDGLEALEGDRFLYAGGEGEGTASSPPFDASACSDAFGLQLHLLPSEALRGCFPFGFGPRGLVTVAVRPAGDTGPGEVLFHHDSWEDCMEGEPGEWIGLAFVHEGLSAGEVEVLISVEFEPVPPRFSQDVVMELGVDLVGCPSP